MGYVQEGRGFADQHSDRQMKTIETVKSVRISGYRILILAILFSFAWHVFWLSMVKVVSAPVRVSQAKFSKVSFLGSILARVGLGVRSQPAERSLLEKRYIALFGKSERPGLKTDLALGGKYDGDSGSAGNDGGKMAYMIDDAVSKPKVEPDYGSE